MAISDKIRQQICAAANYRCEYCKTSSKLTGMPLVMDHILPQVAGGSDEPENLAAACYRCNEFKGSKTHAPDPATGTLVPNQQPAQNRSPETILLHLAKTALALVNNLKQY